MPAGVSPNLLFEWAMPILSGQGIVGWKHLDVGVQCWVLVALKEGLAAVEMPVLHQHALAVLTLCHNLLKSEATSVHLIAPVLGLVSEVSSCCEQACSAHKLAQEFPVCTQFPYHTPICCLTLYCL